MLPEVDINRWNKSDSYGKNLYADRWLHQVNDVPKTEWEGYTTSSGLKLVKALNEYRIKAGRLSWKLFLMKTLFEMGGDIHQANKVFKVLVGLSSQRRMAWAFKKALAENPVDENQTKIALRFIKKISDRLVYLEKTFVPAVSSSSDIIFYLTHLNEQGITLHDELEGFIGEDYFNKYLEDEPEKLAVYLAHVSDIISSMQERKDIAESIEKSRSREEKMYQDSVKSAQRYREELDRKQRDQTEAIVNSLSSRAQKKIAPLKRLHDNKVYICVAAYVPTTHGTVIKSGYVRTVSGKKSITSDPVYAVMYKTEEEAVSAGEDLKAQARHEVIYNVVPIFRR